MCVCVCVRTQVYEQVRREFLLRGAYFLTEEDKVKVRYTHTHTHTSALRSTVHYRRPAARLLPLLRSSLAASVWQCPAMLPVDIVTLGCAPSFSVLKPLS